MSLREIAKVLKLSRPDKITVSAQRLVDKGVINFCTPNGGTKLQSLLVLKVIKLIYPLIDLFKD